METQPPMPAMSSQRPYLLRALYEWIVDNDMTPHVLVDARVPGVRVPPHTVKDGQVVLNIAARAVGHLQMDNDALRFSARFGGVSHNVVVPLPAVIAIYARENGHGMALPQDVLPSAPLEAEEEHEGLGALHADYDPEVIYTPETDAEAAPGDGDDDRPPPRRGHLRVVK